MSKKGKPTHKLDKELLEEVSGDRTKQATVNKNSKSSQNSFSLFFRIFEFFRISSS